MNQLLNKNLHETHLRRLSEIRVRPSKYEAKSQQVYADDPESIWVSQSESQSQRSILKEKQRFLDIVKQLDILNDNVNLADKFLSVFTRKSHYPAATTITRRSLNSKIRDDSEARIRRDNESMFSRLVSQKSIYSSLIHKEDQKSSKKLTSSKKKPLFLTDPTKKPKLHELQILPSILDDFKDRQVLSTKSIVLMKKHCIIELSSSSKFDYLILNFLSSGLRYKLRLSKEMGDAIITQFHNNFQGLVKKLTYQEGQMHLIVPIGTFNRRYTFVKLYPESGTKHKRAKTQIAYRHWQPSVRLEQSVDVNETDDLYKTFDRLNIINSVNSKGE